MPRFDLVHLKHHELGVARLRHVHHVFERCRDHPSKNLQVPFLRALLQDPAALVSELVEVRPRHAGLDVPGDARFFKSCWGSTQRNGLDVNPRELGGQPGVDVAHNLCRILAETYTRPKALKPPPSPKPPPLSSNGMLALTSQEMPASFKSCWGSTQRNGLDVNPRELGGQPGVDVAHNLCRILAETYTRPKALKPPPSPKPPPLSSKSTTTPVCILQTMRLRMTFCTSRKHRLS